MTRIKTLAIGYDGVPAQFPVRDFSAATATALTSGTPATISLAPGHYEIRANVAIEYKHGPVASVAGFVSVPHDADTWLGVSVDRASDLVVTPTSAGTIWVVPAEVY